MDCQRHVGQLIRCHLDRRISNDNQIDLVTLEREVTDNRTVDERTSSQGQRVDVQTQFLGTNLIDDHLAFGRRLVVVHRLAVNRELGKLLPEIGIQARRALFESFQIISDNFHSDRVRTSGVAAEDRSLGGETVTARYSAHPTGKDGLNGSHVFRIFAAGDHVTAPLHDREEELLDGGNLLDLPARLRIHQWADCRGLPGVFCLPVGTNALLQTPAD